LNVHGVNEVRHKEIYTEEALVLEPSAYEVELAFEKLKSQKSPGIVRIPTELINARRRTLRYEIHKITISILK